MQRKTQCSISTRIYKYAEGFESLTSFYPIAFKILINSLNSNSLNSRVVLHPKIYIFIYSFDTRPCRCVLGLYFCDCCFLQLEVKLSISLLPLTDGMEAHVLDAGPVQPVSLGVHTLPYLHGDAGIVSWVTLCPDEELRDGGGPVVIDPSVVAHVVEVCPEADGVSLK